MVSLDTNKTNKIHHHFFGEGGSNANLCPERLTIFGALKLTVQINIKRKKEQISYSKFKITKKKKKREPCIRSPAKQKTNCQIIVRKPMNFPNCKKFLKRKKKTDRLRRKTRANQRERERGGGEEETWMNEIRDELRLSVFSFREEI